ncbi:MAG: CCA tRNA nucleotidyltransferase, partial [Candidatus Heimdallarchaeota archaeon]|nr:CCA tRNA nucleotidyltransferase [Candidatus Heimdallarchaeota archaeon]
LQIKTKPIGGKWGTVLAICDNKQAFDISTYRKETFLTYGKPPEVTFINSLDDDLRRRDFKINTIVYDPLNNQIMDEYHGIEDIENGIISMVGDPDIRLHEDGLRIIRLSRFMSKFKLTPTKEITNAVKSIGKNAKFRSKRVMQIELFKLLRLHDPSIGFHFLVKMDILPSMFPNFPLNSNYQDNNTLELLKRFSLLPITNEITRLFGLLLLLVVDDKNLSEFHFNQIKEDLLLSNRQSSHLNRLYTSWTNFPAKSDTITIKRWVRAAGINASENLVRIYFLNLQKKYLNSKTTNEDTIFKNVQIAVNKLRSG